MTRRLIHAMTSCAVLLLASAWAFGSEPETVGRITRWDAAIDRLIAPDAKIERLAGGFTWSEGPLWIEAGGYLLFSDVPANTMYRWSPGDGLSTFLKPSGYAGNDTAGLREAGSNGLLADGPGTILLADSGNRSIVRLDLATRHRSTVVATYAGKRFNSPNDVIRSTTGVLFFTDPPYGLKDIDASQ